MAAEMTMTDEFNEPRSVDDIERDIKDAPRQMQAFTAEIGHHRRAVQNAFSRWTDTTDLLKERETLIDQGLAVAEAEAVQRSDRLIGAIRADLALLTRAAPTSTLTTTERQDLALQMPIVQELATSAPGARILAEIEGAILRRDRVSMAAWVAVADRVRTRRDQGMATRENGQDVVKALPFEQRGAIEAAIRQAQGMVTDLPMRRLIDDGERTIQELEAFARGVRERANAHDEITDGPLRSYKFGRRPVDASGAQSYARPKPTENWFRRRAGLQVLVEDRE